MRLIDADALTEYFEGRYKLLRSISEEQLPDGRVLVDLEIQTGAIIAKEFFDRTKKAPTIEAEPVRHGRWETSFAEDWDGNMMYTHYHRDCGYTCRNYLDDGTPYCPKCGAKMQE